MDVYAQWSWANTFFLSFFQPAVGCLRDGRLASALLLYAGMMRLIAALRPVPRALRCDSGREAARMLHVR